MAHLFKKIQAEFELYDLVQGHPGFSEFRIETIIKTGPYQVTAVALLNGTKVVIKRSLEPEADRKVQEAKHELDILAARMKDGPYRINTCLAIFPELGIIVLSFVPGLRLDKAIGQADVQERAALMKLSGGWLRKYTENRSEIASKFSPEWWIKKRVTAFGTDQPQAHQDLFFSLVRHLKTYVPLLRGQAITKAAIHGDYSGVNAHYHNGCIYGVDVQGTARLPILQDVAKFLVWSQVKTPLEHPGAAHDIRYIHGISEPDVVAFLESDVLPSEEVETFLPFFIGLQLLQYIGAFERDPLAQSRTGEMVHRFMAPS